MIFTKFIFLLHSHVNYVEVAFLMSFAIEKVSYFHKESQNFMNVCFFSCGVHDEQTKNV